MLLSEVFPFKSRGIASGITAALNYIMAFCTTKTYYNLETSMSLFGVIALYATLDVIGLVFIYFFIPETEKRTLEEIEAHFSDNSKSFSDINIRKLVKPITNRPDKIKKDGCDNKAFEEVNS